MAEMPIDPEFGRFVEGVPGETPEDEIVEFELPEDDTGIEELPDGSAVVTLDKKFSGPEENEDFYSNLAETLDEFKLNEVATRYLELIEGDREDRSERDKQYEEGLRRTGMGNDAPGGATFAGASKVVHPIMAEACVDFASRACKEMFPPDGPTRTNILGEVTEEKEEIAERKRDYMNWQLTEQIEEFRDEQEQMLTQLPLGGSQFMKIYWDDKKKRPCAEFVAIDNILLPFSAANFYTSPRVTEQHDISDWEFNNRIESGLYKDITLIRATMNPDPTKAEKANEKIEGKKAESTEDGIRRVYHVYAWLEIEDDTEADGKSAPYILMIDELDREVVGLYRNWEEGDETMTKLDWIVEFKFIPWRGAYAIGLPHLIGGLSAALTGSLRALLDSAHINNAATMLKLKGAKISGQSQQVDVTQVAEIEGAPGVDDIRKIAMPFPFNPPSPVLFQLLGWLSSAAKGVVTTSEEKIADITSNAPVGTTQALIEQGATVFSSIHARMHNSQRRVLMILQRLNRWYLDEQKKGDVVAELPIKKDDFKRNGDVIPVSDPHIFSETQRMAQIQAVLALSDKNPQLFNRRAVVARALKQMKVPNIQELMPEYSKPIEMHSADENAAMSMGRVAVAYPRQDHLAHIVSHLAFAQDPVMGMNPIIAPQFIPKVLEHVKQHMMLWYTQSMRQYALSNSDLKNKKYEGTKLAPEIDRAMAAASGHVALDIQEKFAQFTPVLQKLLQVMQQMQQRQPNVPLTPDARAVLESSMAETQRRAQRDQGELALKAQKQQQDAKDSADDREVKVVMNTENNLTKERMDTLGLTLEAARLKKEQGESVVALQNAVQRGLTQ
jgi:hypothetical protein